MSSWCLCHVRHCRTRYVCTSSLSFVRISRLFHCRVFISVMCTRSAMVHRCVLRKSPRVQRGQAWHFICPLLPGGPHLFTDLSLHCSLSPSPNPPLEAASERSMYPFLTILFAMCSAVQEPAQHEVFYSLLLPRAREMCGLFTQSPEFEHKP